MTFDLSTYTSAHARARGSMTRLAEAEKMVKKEREGRDRAVLEMVQAKQKSLAAIGSDLGVSKSAVVAMCNRALALIGEQALNLEA